ncbi:autotransporter assembly complex protein TamA [Rhodovulum iodosum]|uniref:autotransporter assembly complex protein TamA n=1 Tax=Rhodovulum iodosum TaxID=68291 RepID=UPI001FE7BAD3|nr:autotransporter assembly complex family protein [Rhodovulum robiginosum]
MRRVSTPLAILLLGLWLGQAARAVEVRLTADGDDTELGEALENASLTVEARRADPPPEAQDLLAAARADYARLLGVLYAQGYYGGVIHIRVDGREVADLPPFGAPARIDRVAITVDPGPRFRFSRAEIAPLAPGTELPDGFAAGKRARASLIEQAGRTSIAAWRDAGHAKAALADQSVVADHDARTLDARLRLDPGPRLRFGRLAIDGRTRVRPERVHAIAGLPEGEVFSPEELQASTERLRRTGTFRSVALREADAANPDGTLDITAALVDEKKRRLGFGAEYGTTDGLTLSGFWMHRNLLRGAERLRLSAEIAGLSGETGGIDYSLGALFERPATFTPDTALYVLGEISADDEPDYKQRDITVGAGLSHIFSDTLEGSAGFLVRYTEIEDDLGDREITQLSFPVSMTRDTRDSELDPRTGTYLSVQAEPFVGLDNPENGARLYADARAYRGFGERVVVAGRVQMGSLLGASADAVPSDWLFYSGGGGTVRGQPYQSLAVDLGNDDSRGGRSFVGLSMELRTGITRSIGVVGFVDAGHIGDGEVPGEGGDWHAGAGLGLRYDTGIGPIRLDVGAPIQGDTGDGVQIYIGIGQAF